MLVCGSRRAARRRDAVRGARSGRASASPGSPAAALPEADARPAADPGRDDLRRGPPAGWRSRSPPRSPTCCPACSTASISRCSKSVVRVHDDGGDGASAARTVPSRRHPALARDHAMVRRRRDHRLRRLRAPVPPDGRVRAPRRGSPQLGGRADRAARPGDGEAARPPLRRRSRLLVAALYALFGMGMFDAVAHAFTTVSTGGFSTHDESLAHFDSAGVEWTAIGAMILAGGNFALYWHALRGKPLRCVGPSSSASTCHRRARRSRAVVLWNMHDGRDVARRTSADALRQPSRSRRRRVHGHGLQPVGRTPCSSSCSSRWPSVAWPVDGRRLQDRSACSPSSDTHGGTSSVSCTRARCRSSGSREEVISESTVISGSSASSALHGRRRRRHVDGRRRSADTTCGRRSRASRRPSATSDRRSAHFGPGHTYLIVRRRRARRPDGHDARRTARALSRLLGLVPLVALRRRQAPAQARTDPGGARLTRAELLRSVAGRPSGPLRARRRRTSRSSP